VVCTMRVVCKGQCVYKYVVAWRIFILYCAKIQRYRCVHIVWYIYMCANTFAILQNIVLNIARKACRFATNNCIVHHRGAHLQHALCTFFAATLWSFNTNVAQYTQSIIMYIYTTIITHIYILPFLHIYQIPVGKMIYTIKVEQNGYS
jgi:hypothetical protein